MPSVPTVAVVMLLTLIAVVIGGAYILAPFMLYWIFGSIERSNDLLEHNNFLLASILVQTSQATTNPPPVPGTVSPAPISVPTFTLLR